MRATRRTRTRAHTLCPDNRMFNIRIAVSNADTAAGGAAAAAAEPATTDPTTSLPFTVGHHEGVVHLFRRVPTREQAETGGGGDEPYEVSK